MRELVYDENGPMSKYLVCVDLKNNCNKFYLVQLTEMGDNGGFLWTRYGRVGDRGVYKEVYEDNFEESIKMFYRVVRQKLKKGYTEVKMNIAQKVEQIKIDTSKYEVSKLDPQVQELITLIFNKKLMEESIAADGFDVKKVAIGELSLESIQNGS